MANLKGGNFEKQVKDIHHRLSAFGVSRHNSNDHLTHSSAVSEKRAEMSQSFAKYCENQGLSGKLNEHMNNDTIKAFLNERTSNLSASTSETYIRGFSSMIDGLKEKNIDISVSKEVFNDMVSKIKDNNISEIKTGRAIDNIDNLISKLYEHRYESGVIAEVQHELALRVSEARELIANNDKYIKNDIVSGIIGKGNHTYINKPINKELQAKINEIEKLPSLRTYQNDLSKFGETSHNFRYTYVGENMFSKSKAELSEELNHKREEMTDRYIARL